MLKVAQYAAQLEDYEKAIQIYEQVMNFDENCLIKYESMEIFTQFWLIVRLPAHVWIVHC